LIQAIFSLVKCILKKINKEPFASNADDYKNMVKTWNKGSNRLNKEMDFQFSLYFLLKSLIFSMLFLGISFSLWLSGSQNRFSRNIMIAFLMFTLLCLIAFLRQRIHLKKLKSAINAEINRPNQQIENS